MKPIKYITFALCIFTINAYANSDPRWVKDSAGYVNEGEITLNKTDGSNFNISFNQSNAGRTSYARTPNIMVVSAGSNYSWSHGFKMDSDSYFIYESKLKTFIEFSNQQMNELFDYEEADFVQLNYSSLYSWPSNRVTYSATFTCGNDSYTGSCRSSGRVTQGNGSGSFSFGGRFATGYSYTMDAYASSVFGTFNIPESFQDVFGEKISSSASGAQGVYGQCSDSDGSGSTCSRSVSSVATLNIFYTFIDNWRDTGIRVGAFEWSRCCTNGGRFNGEIVIGDYSIITPTERFNKLWLSEKADQVVYLNNGDLFSFMPGETPKVAFENTSSIPLSAVTINGVLSEVGSPPP
tara:strand:+ start:2645 stop:3694 length:1050 start_codon:yes stop_codon:yes gene_type:complete